MASADDLGSLGGFGADRSGFLLARVGACARKRCERVPSGKSARLMRTRDLGAYCRAPGRGRCGHFHHALALGDSKGERPLAELVAKLEPRIGCSAWLTRSGLGRECTCSADRRFGSGESVDFETQLIGRQHLLTIHVDSSTRLSIHTTFSTKGTRHETPAPCPPIG